MSQPTSVRPPLTHRRVNALIALRGATPSQLCARLGVSYRHLYGVLVGERLPSDSLLAAIQRELGEAGWHFVTGHSDTLNDKGLEDAAG